MRLDSSKLAVMAVLVLILAGVAWRVSNQMIEKHENERLDRDEQTRIEQAVSRMTAAQNAVSDWKKALGEAVQLEPIYTVSLQKVLVRDDGRPLLFYAHLDDVKEQNGNYLLVFESDVDVRATIRLVLDCEPDRARGVLGRRGSYFERYYAVVAQIRSVRRTGDEEVSGQDDAAKDTTSESKPTFVADGRALDLVFVGRYGFVWDLEG